MTTVLPAGPLSFAQSMRDRNAASAAFFEREAIRLAETSRDMSERFARGGRLLAFGSGGSRSDAQHIAVEFVHPVLVGKRALPAVDLSAAYRDTVPVVARPEDIVVGFAPVAGDEAVATALLEAKSRGALTLALPGADADYAAPAPSADPFITQELIEVAYHTLWETVHVFFEQRPLSSEDSGASFLYPFLSDDLEPSREVVSEVAASIRSKAASVERLRETIAAEQSDILMRAVHAISARVAAGGSVLPFGNGGSATDADDLAYDLVVSAKGTMPIPALSLASDAAVLTAIANDIDRDAMFVRQLIAHGRAGDVAVAISTSGGSSNIIAALAEARTRGLLTVALVGYNGGDIARRALADHVIAVDSDQIPRIQEAQASIYHVMVDALGALRARS